MNTDLRPLVGKLENTLAALAEIRRLLGIETAGTTKVDEINALHHAWTHFQINRVDQVEELLLRPVAPSAKMLDCPTGKLIELSHGKKGNREDAFSKAFVDYRPVAENTIVNEEFITVEYRARATPRRELVVGSARYALPERPVDFVGAMVAQTKNGEVIQIDHYYDFSAPLRYLGLLSGPPAGHDETTTMHGDHAVPPLVHGAGFVSPETVSLRPLGLAPGKRAIAIGSGKSERAKRNTENCTQIHLAFEEHTPEKFAKLIEPDAIWIDVPTAVVLNGAVAAAEHDHGNWQMAFPDATAIVDRIIANDTCTCVQHRGAGSHKGNLVIGGRSFPPTGKRMEIRVLDIVQYNERSKAILIRNYYDTAMMMAQLGISL